MKNFLTLLTIGALLVSTLLVAVPAYAGPQFEDPQLCLNGKLLMVEALTGSDVEVQVASDVKVGKKIEKCGGDPNLPVIDDIEIGGKKGTVEVTVETRPKSEVRFTYDGNTVTLTSGSNGKVTYKFSVN